jgi:hypothetical protein
VDIDEDKAVSLQLCQVFHFACTQWASAIVIKGFLLGVAWLIVRLHRKALDVRGPVYRSRTVKIPNTKRENCSGLVHL